MFAAMGDPQYSSHFGRTPNYDGLTPQSAVSSFNQPFTYNSSLVTPTSMNADSPVLINKTASSIPWGREQTDMNYPMRDTRTIFNQNANTRMKSNAKDSPLSLQVPQISDVGDLGLGFNTYNLYDSPLNPTPPTPYFGSYCVSAAQVTSPTASLPSNAHSTPQLTNASTPSMNHNTPIAHNTAPILTTPTPGQLRPGKRTHESPIKTEHPAMQFQHRPAQQHSHSPHYFNPPTKRESPPLPPTSKRRKPSGPTSPIFEADRRTSSAGAAHSSQSAALASQAPHYIPTDEERLLLHLRDEREPKPDWKTTVAEFNEKMGKSFRVPALQMRYSRLKERQRVWSEKDIKALQRAKAAYEKTKWANIARDMEQGGSDEKWTGRACQLKYAELNPDELDEAPSEEEAGTSPGAEACGSAQTSRQNSFGNLGGLEYGMGGQGQGGQGQGGQAQRQGQRESPGERSPEQSVGEQRGERGQMGRVASASGQLQMMQQQQQVQVQQQHYASQRRQMESYEGRQLQQHQQGWSVRE